MLRLFAGLVALFVTGCSIPELERSEPTITMAPASATAPSASPVSEPKPKVRTLAEARKTQIEFKGSAFPQYDRKIVDAVQKRWYELLATVPTQASGKVVVEFRLVYDGRVAELRIAEAEFTGVAIELCKQAVLDSAPFQPWPSSMREIFPMGRRDVRFTFQYHGP